MTNFKFEYQRARARVEAKAALGTVLKAYKRAPAAATDIRVRAIGTKERDRLIALGWSVEGQDVSLGGQWVRQYDMVKSRSDVYLALKAADLV